MSLSYLLYLFIFVYNNNTDDTDLFFDDVEKKHRSQEIRGFMSRQMRSIRPNLISPILYKCCLFPAMEEMLKEAIKLVNLNLEINGKRDYEPLMVEAMKKWDASI